MTDKKQQRLTSYQAAIRLEGEDLLADFPDLLNSNQSDEYNEQEWLKGARESLLEWMKEQGELLPVKPKRFVVKKGERSFDLPLS